MKKENKSERSTGNNISVIIEKDVTLSNDINSVKNLFLNNFLLGVAGKIAKLGGWSIDIPSHKIYWSDEVCDIHEAPRGQSPALDDGIRYYAPEYRDIISKAISDCEQSGIPFDLELQIITAKGNRIWVRAIGEAVKDEKDRIIKIQGAFQDISVGKKSEANLRESEAKYRSLIESSLDAIFINQNNRIVYINPAGIDLFGAKNKEDLLGKYAFDFFPPEYHEIITQRMKMIMDTGQNAPALEYKFTRLDGKVIDVEVTAALIELNGQPAFQVVLHDISKRKENERKLISSEERFRKAFNSHPGIIGISTVAEGRYLDVNDNFCKILEYDRSEVIGHTSKKLNIFLKENQRDELYNIIKRNGVVNNFEVTIKSKTGKEKVGLFSAELIEMGGEKCLLGQFNDITELRKSIDELHSSEEKFSKVFHSSAYAIAIAELDSGRFTDVNESFEKFTGYNKEEIIGKTTVDLNIWVNSEDRDMVIKTFMENGSVYVPELKFRMKSGDIRTWSLSIELFSFGDGKYTIGMFDDITVSKRDKDIISAKLHLSNFSLNHSLDELLEETLNEAEKLTDSLIGFYHFVDDDQQYLSLQNWSTRTKDIFCKAEGKGSHYPIDEAGVWVDCIKTGKPVIHNNYEALTHKKGLPYGHAEVIRELVVPVSRNGKIKSILGVGNKPIDYNEKDVETVSLLAELVWEITERKRMDEELKESESKLREMVATKDKFFNIIAHDLRSPFNAIMGFSDLLEEQMKEKNYEGIEEYSRFIHSASKRSMSLLSNLLEWSRSQTGKIKFEPEYFDLAFLIKEVVELFKDVAEQKSIQLRKVMPANILFRADKSMIENILRNLISNAIKFSNVNGIILIQIDDNEKDLVVSIKDNGVGIEPENIPKLFRLDINYTTPGTQKEKGTGLGLLLCKEFVEKHGGKLKVESNPETGSVFSFNIPKKQTV